MRFFPLFLTFFSPIFIRCQSNQTELMFVEALWRNGYRSALADLKPLTEADWIEGGGGFGQLTTDGMAQMFRLGELIRKEYINKNNFLSNRYNSKEIYIFSTDRNRTISSASSLLLGLYSSKNESQNIPDVDYPNLDQWPSGLTFIPIHTNPVQDITDPDTPCSRYDNLISAAMELDEYKDWWNTWSDFESEVQKNYGISAESTSFLHFSDTLFFQRIYFNSTLYQIIPWYNEEFYNKTQIYVSSRRRFVLGVFESDSSLNGIEIGKEIQILKGGPIMNEILSRATAKLNGSLEHLKFYGYSTSGRILYAALNVLGISQVTETLSWPDFSSALFFEFYIDRKSNEAYFKINYRTKDESDVRSITNLINGCKNENLCPIGILQSLVDDFQPIPDFPTLCETPLSGKRNFKLGLSTIFLILYSIKM